LRRPPRQFADSRPRLARLLTARPGPVSPAAAAKLEVAARTDARKPVAYYDFTFSTVKSVYAALLLVPGSAHRPSRWSPITARRERAAAEGELAGAPARHLIDHAHVRSVTESLGDMTPAPSRAADSRLAQGLRRAPTAAALPPYRDLVDVTVQRLCG
jgi:hypothetical protein